MHQKNKKETKAWYRCTRYESNQCRATAVVHISSGTLLKVTRSHVHSPGFLQDFARFENNFFIFVHGHMSSSLSLCTLSRWNIVVLVPINFLLNLFRILSLHVHKKLDRLGWIIYFSCISYNYSFFYLHFLAVMCCGSDPVFGMCCGSDPVFGIWCDFDPLISIDLTFQICYYLFTLYSYFLKSGKRNPISELNLNFHVFIKILPNINKKNLLILHIWSWSRNRKFFQRRNRNRNKFTVPQHWYHTIIRIFNEFS